MPETERIVDYCIVRAAPHNYHHLKPEVLTLIEEGWEPAGGLGYCHSFYCQAMVKREQRPIDGSGLRQHIRQIAQSVATLASAVKKTARGVASNAEATMELARLSRQQMERVNELARCMEESGHLVYTLFPYPDEEEP
jgi:hypothetical protein